MKWIISRNSWTSLITIIILIAISIKISECKLYPNGKLLQIYKNEGFLIYLKPDSNDNGKALKSCILKYQDKEFDLFEAGAKYKGENNEIIRKYVIGDLCGAQIFGVVPESEGIINLSSENIDGSKDEGDMKIIVLGLCLTKSIKSL